MDNQLFVELGLLTQKFAKGLNDASSRIEKFGQRAQEIGNNISIGFSLPFALAARQMVNGAMNMEESINKVQVAFGEASKSVLNFSDTTLKTIGVSKGTALDMTALFGDMATSMGINQKQAAKMSIELAKLAGDMASFKNIKVDIAQTALNSVFTGETESLKLLGVVMTEANLNNFLMEKGINKKVQSLNEAQKVMLRYEYVMAKTKNSQGDFARTSDGAANQTRILQQTLQEKLAVLGQQFLPMYTAVIQKVTDLIEWFSDLDGGTQKLIIGLAGVVAIGGPILSFIGTLIPLLGSLAVAVGAATLPFTLIAVAVGVAGVALWAYYDDVREVLLKILLEYSKFKLELAKILTNVPGFTGMGAQDQARIQGNIVAITKSLSAPTAKGENPVKKLLKDITLSGDELSKKLAELSGNGNNGIPGGIKKLSDKSEKEALNFGTKLQAAFLKIRPMIADILTPITNQLAGSRGGQMGILQGLTDSLGIDIENLGKHSDSLKSRFNEIASGISNFGEKAPKTMTDANMKMKEVMDETKKILIDFKDGLKSLAVEFGTGIIEGIITDAFGGNFNWKQMFSGFLRAISQFMADFGKRLILIGIGKSAAVGLSGPQAIAAGIALIAGAGIAGAAATRLGQNSVSSQAGNPGALAPSFNVQGAFTLRGNDLVAAINNTNAQFGR